MTEEWAALADAVRRRRVELGLRQSDLEARGGPSQGTVRNIEQAARTKYASRTFAQLETALGWRPGAAGSVLAGGNPTLRSEPSNLRVLRPPSVQPERDPALVRGDRRCEELFGAPRGGEAWQIISYRDALDRADTLKSAAEAHGLLALVKLNGDHDLGKTIALKSFIMGWDAVVDAWAEGDARRGRLLTDFRRSVKEGEQ